MSASEQRPVALLTAASRGIGAGIARRLHRDGYVPAMLARSAEVEALADELDGLAVRGSVTETGDLDALVATAMQRYGRIDAVVVNTGHPPKGDLLDLTDDDWHTGLDLVLMATVRLARRVTPIMEAAGGGSWVNISTFGAREPSAAFPVSSALRAGLGAFTKLYADRYGGSGIRMNSVLPGFVETYPIDDAVRQQIPVGRAARVEEIAGTVSWLLSADAAYITGRNIVVDGGLTRSW